MNRGLNRFILQYRPYSKLEHELRIGWQEVTPEGMAWVLSIIAPPKPTLLGFLDLILEMPVSLTTPLRDVLPIYVLETVAKLRSWAETEDVTKDDLHALIKKSREDTQSSMNVSSEVEGIHCLLRLAFGYEYVSKLVNPTPMVLTFRAYDAEMAFISAFLSSEVKAWSRNVVKERLLEQYPVDVFNSLIEKF